MQPTRKVVRDATSHFDVNPHLTQSTTPSLIAHGPTLRRSDNVQHGRGGGCPAAGAQVFSSQPTVSDKTDGHSADNDFTSPTRLQSTYKPLSTFVLPADESRSYQHQFADMYFLRLAELKPAIETVAAAAFASHSIAGETARRVDRVLDVRQGELCWVVGTVYMEMALKPNVLDDISKEHWIAAPPPREKFVGADGAEQVMLEDESGRLRLAGPVLRGRLLVTGCIVAVLGTENRDGEFEVLEVVDADLPRQAPRWEEEDGEDAGTGKEVVRAGRDKTGGKIAIISGLDIDGTRGDDLFLDQLTTFLRGEGPEQEKASRITRLIIAGDSLADSSP
ncbi:MAG: hypothetical protein INR71_03130, partial [Terriglobus roseus]|nr:hypothetical protein [Terriglobus roseus]